MAFSPGAAATSFLIEAFAIGSPLPAAGFPTFNPTADICAWTPRDFR
jgi:hypothetical protein